MKLLVCGSDTWYGGEYEELRNVCGEQTRVISGYGVAEAGVTALRSALVSCAPGVVAVNIDNGYGAACAALRALRH